MTRQLLAYQARLAGATEARVLKVTLEVLDVSFDAIPDPKERAYFMNLPTSFVLLPEDVDRLREVASCCASQWSTSRWCASSAVRPRTRSTCATAEAIP